MKCLFQKASDQGQTFLLLLIRQHLHWFQSQRGHNHTPNPDLVSKNILRDSRNCCRSLYLLYTFRNTKNATIMLHLLDGVAFVVKTSWVPLLPNSPPPYAAWNHFPSRTAFSFCNELFYCFCFSYKGTRWCHSCIETSKASSILTNGIHSLKNTRFVSIYVKVFDWVENERKIFGTCSLKNP